VAEARGARRAPPRARRSHAERTAETRAKILTAVVDSIAEVGFHRTTAVEITRRAGVTWGAVQHHFGDKDGILVAVLEDSFGRFAARLEDVPVERLSFERRVALFVERAWQHFTSREYASTFEILLDHLRREDLPAQGGARWQIQMSRAWERVWRRFFGDAVVPRKRQLRLQHYTIAVLSGLASTRMLEGGEPLLPRDELALLESTLVRELKQAG
jgi:AcrR family transcriptional regulator